MEKKLYKKAFLIKPVLLMILFVGLSACERFDNRTEKPGQPGKNIDKTKYDAELKDFSLAVSEAIKEDLGFRKLVREESLRMFDGDYDVLLSKIMDTEVPESTLTEKSRQSGYCVRDLLEKHIRSVARSAFLKSSDSPIDDLIEQYPYLQIAVPVNAEEWDPEKYVPSVTFLPYDYDDQTTKTLTAYTADGTVTELDAVTPPDVPVLVVGMNERFIIEEPKGSVIPPNPTNLAGSVTESGIRLTWLMPDTADTGNTEGYYIYRKAASDATYIRYSTVYGVYNRTFDDNLVESERVYSYYVVAFYDIETSLPSNYISVTAPQKPKPVASFDAIQHAKNEVELRWQNDNNQYIEYTKISKYVVGVDAGYKLFGTYSSNEFDTFDRNITPGRKTIYKAQHVAGTHESNPKYDFIQAPYRDISQNSPVYIKQIKFTDWSIERWPAGKPEFYITVTNVEPVNKNPFKVQDQINCEFNSKERTSQVFNGVKVLDWQPGFWYDMLTFTAIEYDRSFGTLEVKIGVGYNMKDTLKLGFVQGSAGIEYKITFNDKGEECGSSYLDYYDLPETWLVFPNYGVKILISEIDK